MYDDVVAQLKADTELELDEHDRYLLSAIRRLRHVAATNPPSVVITLEPSRARLWAAFFEELLMLRHGTGDDG
jgi:hypothetical protein